MTTYNPEIVVVTPEPVPTVGTLYACEDCLIAANDPTYVHPLAAIEYADIWSTNFDYCSDHYSEPGKPCGNCDDGSGEQSAYYDLDDGTGITLRGQCDLCGHKFTGYWTYYRFTE